MRRFATAALAALGLFAPAATAAAQGPRAVPASPTDSMIAAARHPWSRWPDFPRYVDDASRLYAPLGGGPLWLDGGRLAHAGRAAIDQLLAAGAHGLDPRDYDAALLDSLARRPPAEPDRARFDLLLTIDLLRYLDDLRTGRTHPRPLGPLGPPGAAPARWDAAAAMAQAIQGDSIPGLVQAVVPQLAQYRNLQKVLARYRALAADSSLRGPLGLAVPLAPGARAPGVAALRRRLVALGDLAPDAAGGPADLYDGPMVAAVRHFQLRHGLEVDGVLGRGTVAALEVPAARRVRQLELALERLRWLPPLGRQPFIVVNIPMFELFGFDSVGGTGAPALEMRVIVGKALDTRTPVFLQQLRYVEFRPYWNVPRSIVVNEILPRLRRQPGYLRANEMELVGPRDRVLGDVVTPAEIARLERGELRVRQRPGALNSLGAAKFIFPNAANVYLHGTPRPEFFARTRRDFSHGCVRLEDPAALAAWVLRDRPGWSRDSAVAAMAAPQTRRVLLDRPMPVVIFYTTAVARPDGTAWFFDDIYGHDRTLDEALRAGPTPP